jgi:hypothetical protein
MVEERMRCLVAVRTLGFALGLSLPLLGAPMKSAGGASEGGMPQEQCQGLPANVVAASTQERRVACHAVRQAVDLVGRCGIALQRPLHVQVRADVRHPFGKQVFGYFDTKRERVIVAELGKVTSLVKGTPYAALPQADFYRSLIVHEVVHGIMYHNLTRPVTSQAAYEYPAYAIQIESLSPDLREQFLGSFEQEGTSRPSLFSDSILSFDPFYFAARAYRHFNASGNGCAHLHALLEGEVSFIVPQ